LTKSIHFSCYTMDRVKRCIQFLDASPEPFHVIKSVVARLSKAGFVPLSEAESWRGSGALKAGGKYFFTRNGSSIVAFVVGGQYKPGHGFKVLGAHTDSPNLKLKPCSKKSANGVIQLNVECYGGGLWHTWFDRDLSIAGRVILRDTTSSSSEFRHALLKIDRSVLRIPNLCVHLRSQKEREAFAINNEDNLMPILCSAVRKTFHSKGSAPAAAAAEEAPSSKKPKFEIDPSSFEDAWKAGQQPELMEMIAQELNVSVGDILDFELSLYDTQGAGVSGSTSEFLCSSRLDNLASCFVGMEALETHATLHAAADEDVSIVAMFDHEEVGSQSYSGAGSTLIGDAIERISFALAGPEKDNLELHKMARQR
jgi:aspartyl aminopeptidase